MVGVRNRLSDSLAKLQNIYDVDFWSGSNLEIGQGGSSELFDGFSEFKQISLKVTAGNQSGTLFHEDIQLEEGDFNQDIVFLFAVKMPSGGLITCSIADVDLVGGATTTTALNLSQSDAVINAPGILSPQWNIFRSNMFQLESNQQLPAININIIFEPNDPNETFYFTTPAVYPAYEFSSANDSVALIASYLPDVMFQADLDAETTPDRAMLRLIDIATLGLGESLELTREFAYVDTEEGFSSSDSLTKSTLVNSSVAELETLIWLCKFSGTQPITRFNFSPEIVSDAFILESSDLNSEDQLRLTSFTELNPPLLDTDAQETLLRWQLDTGYYGKNAGTLNALTEAAKLQLINTKTVYVTYDYDTAPYEINIQTKWSETIGAVGPEVIGQSSEIILESIEPARPLGTKITHEYVE
jgi:hypothetical protein